MREKSGDLGQGDLPLMPAKISCAASAEEISTASGESRTTAPGELDCRVYAWDVPYFLCNAAVCSPPLPPKTRM